MKIGLRELSFFLLLVGILAAAAWFVFLPHWRQVERIERDNEAKQARLAQLDRLGQTSASLNKELSELSKALDFFESKLPEDQQISNVLREVTQITEKHGLTTRSVRTLQQIESSQYVAQPIEMETAGPFEGFYEFLLDLEKLPRITRITQMEASKDKGSDGRVQVKMVVLVYFEPPDRAGSGASGRPSETGAPRASTNSLRRRG